MIEQLNLSIATNEDILERINLLGELAVRVQAQINTLHDILDERVEKQAYKIVGRND